MRKLIFFLIFVGSLGYLVCSESGDSMKLPSTYKPNDKDLQELYYNYHSSQCKNEKDNIVYKVSSNFVHYQSKSDKLNSFIKSCLNKNEK